MLTILHCRSRARSGTNYTVTHATDRIGGFTAQEISDLTRVSQRLPLLACIASAASPATN
jgi:hypothetical protein